MIKKILYIIDNLYLKDDLINDKKEIISFSFFLKINLNDYKNYYFIFLKNTDFINDIDENLILDDKEYKAKILTNIDIDKKQKFWKNNNYLRFWNESFFVFDFFVMEIFFNEIIFNEKKKNFTNIIMKKFIFFEIFLFLFSKNKDIEIINTFKKNNREIEKEPKVLELFNSLGFFENFSFDKNNKITNGLSFLIIFSGFKKDFWYFVDLIEKVNNKDVEFIFVFDTNNINFSFVIELINKGIKFKFNYENVGKFKTIIKSTQELVSKKWLKIVDYDDSLIWYNIDDFVEKLKLQNENSLIKHSGAKITKRNLFYKTLDFKKTKRQVSNSIDEFYNQQTNFDTIYPTKIINNSNFDSIKRQNFHNDVLLSNLIKGMGYPLVFVYGKIYLQFHEKGQTSEKNIDRMLAINELYQSYYIFSKNNISFKIENLLLSYSNHVNFIKKFTVNYDNNSELSKIILKTSTINLDKLFFGKSKYSKDNFNNFNYFYVGYLIDNNIEVNNLLTSIYSAYLNGKCNNFKILSYFVDDVKLKEIYEFASKLKLELEIVKINDKVIEIKSSKNENEISHISNTAFFKIYFPKLFKDNNILYLDVDTMIVGSLSKFDNIKSNKAISVVRNGYLSEKYWLRIYKQDGIYNKIKEVRKNAFNSGVIYFSKNEKSNYFVEKYINSIKNNNFKYLDQSHFNFVYKKNANFIDLKYNWPHHKRNKKIIKKNKSNPIIIHFASKYKPWTKRKSYEYTSYENLWKFYNDEVVNLKEERKYYEEK